MLHFFMYYILPLAVLQFVRVIGLTIYTLFLWEIYKYKYYFFLVLIIENYKRFPPCYLFLFNRSKTYSYVLAISFFSQCVMLSS